MGVELVSTPNGISTLNVALKYCQNFARICYAPDSFEDIKKEGYNSRLVRGLVRNGHHSVFDHFNMSLYLDGLPKAMAMVLNNEPPLATSEKSARYTEMMAIPGEQKRLYDKWKNIIRSKTRVVYPEDKFPRLYKKVRGVAPEEKLAQENARYMTSVFTPTKMGYTISLRQLNLLADNFERFDDADSDFKQRLFVEGMLPFLQSDVVKRFRVKGLVDKSDRGVKLFGGEVENHFGESVYSTNLDMSFACLAQNHRHRTIHNHIVDGYDKSLLNKGFVPPVIKGDDALVGKWIEDTLSVIENDYPQGQMIRVAERGNREDLEMKCRERNCGLAQLEIVRVLDGLLDEYGSYVSEMGDLRGPVCEVSGEGCKKGGCNLGADLAIDRLI